MRGVAQDDGGGRRTRDKEKRVRREGKKIGRTRMKTRRAAERKNRK